MFFIHIAKTLLMRFVLLSSSTYTGLSGNLKIFKTAMRYFEVFDSADLQWDLLRKDEAKYDIVGKNFRESLFSSQSS